MESSKKERPVAKRLRNRNIFVEDGPLVAKKRRTGNHDSQNLESKVDEFLKQIIPLSLGPQNGQQIIQEKQRIIEDLEVIKLKLQAQILGQQAQITKITKAMGPLLETKLPDEILVKIFGYLSSYDLLSNVARVSKKFKKLSEDPFLIRKIELHKSLLTKDQVRGCLKVLTMSKNLKFFSFDLNWNLHCNRTKDFLKALPTFNHQHLEEFCIKGHFESFTDDQGDASGSLIRKLMRYLRQCPNLKILKIEFEEDLTSDPDDWTQHYCDLRWLEAEDIFRYFKFQNLEELHFNGFDFDLSPHEFRDIFHKFQKNLPQLRRLCFKLDNIENLEPQHDQILQKFASEKNVKIEITGTPVYTARRILEVEHPSSGFKIFNPIRK